MCSFWSWKKKSQVNTKCPYMLGRWVQPSVRVGQCVHAVQYVHELHTHSQDSGTASGKHLGSRRGVFPPLVIICLGFSQSLPTETCLWLFSCSEVWPGNRPRWERSTPPGGWGWEPAGATSTGGWGPAGSHALAASRSDSSGSPPPLSQCCQVMGMGGIRGGGGVEQSKWLEEGKGRKEGLREKKWEKRRRGEESRKWEETKYKGEE